MIQLTIPQRIWVYIEMNVSTMSMKLHDHGEISGLAPTVRPIMKNYDKYLRHGIGKVETEDEVDDQHKISAAYNEF